MMKIAYKILPLTALIFALLSAPLVLRADDKTSADTFVKYAPVTLNIDLKSHGKEIPANFSGLSFETGSLRPGNAGTKGHFFDENSKQGLNLFGQMGIKSLRVGGGAVDFNKTAPTNADIDALFAFAKAANVKVIYSLRLLNGNAAENVDIAKYIWSKYLPLLDGFSIGNEPDWNSYHKQDPEITDYPSYLSKWRRFAAAVVKAIPAAKFSGPNTGSNYPVPEAKSTNYNGKSWTVNFANDEKNSGLISFIAQHNYVGQSADGRTINDVIDNMLSPDWTRKQYPALYETNLEPVIADGFAYRLAESNSFSGQVDGGSNSFATALFGLDYMHWWAEHNCLGVNFHNKQWVKNAPIFMDQQKNYQLNPLGYGITAFNLGGHGSVQPITVANGANVNLTAYAVKGKDTLYVTVINKEHGNGAQAANVSIKALGIKGRAKAVFLTANGNAAATSGITLGGVTINNDTPWAGKWVPVVTDNKGNYTVKVQATSAVIIKIPTK
jgi:hypothetical protein